MGHQVLAETKEDVELLVSLDHQVLSVHLVLLVYLAIWEVLGDLECWENQVTRGLQELQEVALDSTLPSKSETSNRFKVCCLFVHLRTDMCCVWHVLCIFRHLLSIWWEHLERTEKSLGCVFWDFSKLCSLVLVADYYLPNHRQEKGAGSMHSLRPVQGQVWWVQFKANSEANSRPGLMSPVQNQVWGQCKAKWDESSLRPSVMSPVQSQVWGQFEAKSDESSSVSSLRPIRGQDWWVQFKGKSETRSRPSLRPIQGKVWGQFKAKVWWVQFNVKSESSSRLKFETSVRSSLRSVQGHILLHYTYVVL